MFTKVCDTCTVVMGVNNIYSVVKKLCSAGVMSCPLVQYQAYNHLALGFGDYKPDIALVVWHNLYIYIYINK